MSEPPRVLVTGGAGYVGSHACKFLAAAGCLPVVVDDLSEGHAWAVKWGPLEVCALQAREALAQIVARHRPVAVLHFAAFIAAGESVERPDKYYENNVGGLLSLLSVLRTTEIRNIIFSSTAAVYGDPQRIPLDEDHPKAPVSPYGQSKLMGERILEDFARAFGFRPVFLRYFNASGADPDGEIGEAHEPETHLLPLALRAARDPDFTLSVNGTDYPTPDGTAIRDYVHVVDLAEAHVAALRYLEAGGIPQAFNLGTGYGYSVRQVIETVTAAAGMPVKHRLGPRRPGDPPVLVASSAKAQRILGWRPRLSALADIVDTALRWDQACHGACHGADGRPDAGFSSR